MRNKYVIGNWKMNTDLEEGIKLATELSELIAKQPVTTSVGVAIAPPYTHLTEVKKSLGFSPVKLAAQNCSSEPQGAYTGEVSPSMLKSVGTQAVIIGHSERRSYYHESNEILARKVALVLSNSMTVVFCCGEVLSERESNKQNEVVESQLREGIYHLTPEQMQHVIIAYEPVWAIGTGVVASPQQAQEMHAFIRQSLLQKYGKEVSENTSILYGGSCKASNAVELFSQKDVDGGLIGGAALKADEFVKIIDSL